MLWIYKCAFQDQANAEEQKSCILLFGQQSQKGEKWHTLEICSHFLFV